MTPFHSPRFDSSITIGKSSSPMLLTDYSRKLTLLFQINYSFSLSDRIALSIIGANLSISDILRFVETYLMIMLIVEHRFYSVIHIHTF